MLEFMVEFMVDHCKQGPQHVADPALYVTAERLYR